MPWAPRWPDLAERSHCRGAGRLNMWQGPAPRLTFAPGTLCTRPRESAEGRQRGGRSAGPAVTSGSTGHEDRKDRALGAEHWLRCSCVEPNGQCLGPSLGGKGLWRRQPQAPPRDI